MPLSERLTDLTTPAGLPHKLGPIAQAQGYYWATWTDSRGHVAQLRRRAGETAQGLMSVAWRWNAATRRWQPDYEFTGDAGD